MTPKQKEWAKKRAMDELKDFIDYTKDDPMPLLVGAGTALVLIAAGSYKVVALATGAVVSGALYACSRKPRKVYS